MSIRNKAQQMHFIDYSGLAYNRKFEHDSQGVFSPMDIDGIYQFSKKSHKEMLFNQAVLFYEFKFNKKDQVNMSVGQTMCYEALANAFAANGDLAMVVVVSHSDDYKEGGDDINGSAGIVRKFYYNHNWHEIKRPMTALEFTDLFMRYAGLLKDR